MATQFNTYAASAPPAGDAHNQPRSAVRPTRKIQAHRRRYPVVAAAASVALGAGILLAPSAGAADKWGPGFLIPNSSGVPDASHLGTYGKPGTEFPDAVGHAYCADPTLEGPETAGHYGPITTFTSWTAKSTGKTVPAQNVARAAYVLSAYGDTTNDAQAAAVDAVVYTLVDPGTTYALPSGQRALQRLAYPGVPAAVRTKADAFLTEAAKYAGAYTLNIHTDRGPVRPGEKTPITLDVTSASGAKLPGITIRLAESGAVGGAEDVTTTSAGTATAAITPGKTGTVDLTAEAVALPATALRAQLPSNPGAQRMLVGGGTSRATATARLQVATPTGSIKITKTAADTHKALASVRFDIKDAAGTTVATGTTNTQGQLTASDLAPGMYTVHEVQAVEGYEITVAPTDVDVIAQVPDHPTATPTTAKLTLVTCWPAYGHAKRVVVEADLVSAKGGA